MLTLIVGVFLVSFLTFKKEDEEVFLPPPVSVDNLTYSRRSGRDWSKFTRFEEELLGRYAMGSVCKTYAKRVGWIMNEPVVNVRNFRMAKITHTPQPAFSEQIEQEHWEKVWQGLNESICAFQCQVMVRATLNANGEVTNLSFVDLFNAGNLPMKWQTAYVKCVESSLEAAKQIRFKPATKYGKPVSQNVAIIYDSWGRGSDSLENERTRSKKVNR